MGGGLSIQRKDPLSNDFYEEALKKQSYETGEITSAVTSGEHVRPNSLGVVKLSKYPYMDFKLLKMIGTGKFSKIFKAISTKEVALLVALKEVRVNEMNKQQLYRFRHELNILSQLRHRNIIQIASIYDPSPNKSPMYIIMEHLNGGELLSAICRQPHYMESDVRRFIGELTSAIQYLHQRGVIHGFIIPENLVLTNSSFESSLKLADFTYAEIIHAPSLLTYNNHNYNGQSLSHRQLTYLTAFKIPELYETNENFNGISSPSSSSSSSAAGTTTLNAPTSTAHMTMAIDIWCLGSIAHILLSGLEPFENSNIHHLVSVLFVFFSLF
jgi:serine/threonine protein kinase